MKKNNIEHKAKYKPLSFDTTMRNPSRIAAFLRCLLDFEGQTLTNDVIHSVIKKIILCKEYKPNGILECSEYKDIYNSEDDFFNDDQLEDIIKKSPQDHKTAGYDHGWPSRFDTFYQLPKEYGLVWYNMNEKIKISETGHMLIDALNQVPSNSRKIQNVFLNAMCKYQSANPFRKTLNDNVPMLLLLKVIKRLKDEDPKSTGIFRSEISFFICWPNSNDEALFNYIKRFRSKYKFSQYTDEIVYNECLSLLGYGEKNKNYIKMSKVTGESVDEYIRKMRITGLLSLRGNGRFLDYNTIEQSRIDYVLKKYATYKKYSTRSAYFDYMSEADQNLFDIKGKTVPLPILDALRQKKLKEFANTHTKEEVYKELNNLCSKRESKDPVLKFIGAPVRLEFLSSVALVQQFSGLEVMPNYAIDDEGLPVFTAGGNVPDIICKDKINDELVEVTLMTSKNDQINQEMLSITRHQKDAKATNANTYSVFVAPRIHPDTSQYVAWVEYKDAVRIKAYDIPAFIDMLKGNTSLDSVVMA